MLFLMCMAFYTSRIVLELLGIEDFGIYNVVGGLVTLLSFLNNSLITSTQRFLSYELGQTEGDVQKCFVACLVVVFIISVIIILICETVGVWYINNKLVIPENKMGIVNIVFHLSVLSILFSTIRSPFVSLIISFENMSSYSIISILESVFKLLSVLILKFFFNKSTDNLIIYMIFLTGISLFVTVIYICYCRYKYYNICFISKSYDKKKVKDISKFAGWNVLGMLSDIGVPQGINLLINGFGGVIQNAAMGIANQVTSAVYGLVSNFQMAFRPQIVKSYSSQKNSDLNKLIISSSKISFFLMLYMAIPFIIRANDLMIIWLNIFPKNAVVFSQLMVCVFIIDSISGPLWMTIQATGKIKLYQIATISLSVLFLLISYFMLKGGANPLVILYNRIILSFCFLVLQMVYLKKIFDFSLIKYWNNVIRNFAIGLTAFAVVYYISYSCFLFQNIIGSFFISTVIITLLIFLFGLSRSEKKQVNLLFVQFKSKIK